MVLVHLRTNSIFSLNPTAARVWELLETGCNRSDLLVQLEEEFEVGRDRLAREVDGLLSTFSREGLLQNAGSDS
jgi:hypothetical protein